MSVDFAALAGSVEAGLPEVRACLLVSRDGLPLGVAPASEELRAMNAWSRLASLGDVEKGFVAMAEDVWVFCRRGPFGALALADPAGRPGIVLARLEEALLVAEEARARREDLRAAVRDPSVPDATRRLRPPMIHRERPLAPSSESVSVSIPAPEATVPIASAATRATAPAPPPGPVRQVAPRPDAPEAQSVPFAPPEQDDTDDLEVDAVALAREFGALYLSRPEDEAEE